MSKETSQCSLCSTQTPNLIRVESGLRLGMQKEGLSEVPEEICGPCLKLWRKKITTGVKLAADQQVRQNLAADLWKGRLPVSYTHLTLPTKA